LDDNTRFIIERMDDSEQRVLSRIDALIDRINNLEAWRNKVVGVGLIAGGVGSLLMEVMLNKI